MFYCIGVAINDPTDQQILQDEIWVLAIASYEATVATL